MSRQHACAPGLKRATNEIMITSQKSSGLDRASRQMIEVAVWSLN
jgi:hypothetical protein